MGEKMTLHDRVEFALRDAGFDLDEASRIATLADPHLTQPAQAVDVLDSEDLAVLRRLRDALPDVGLNGWHRGVTVLNKLLTAALPNANGKEDTDAAR